MMILTIGTTGVNTVVKYQKKIACSFAHEPSECCCDCTSWGNYREYEGYDDLDNC